MKFLLFRIMLIISCVIFDEIKYIYFFLDVQISSMLFIILSDVENKISTTEYTYLHL